MTTDIVLTESLARKLISCRPATEDQKEKLLQEVKRITRLTRVGLQELIKRWKKWDVHYRIPFYGVSKIDDDTLQYLARSKIQFGLGLHDLRENQARLIAASNAPYSPSPAINLKHLHRLTKQVAAILMAPQPSESAEPDYFCDPPGFSVNGDAAMDEETLRLLLSRKNDRVRIDDLTEANARFLSALPSTCSLKMLGIYRPLTDEAALCLSRSVPWFPKEDMFLYFKAIPGSEGHVSLMRRFGCSHARLSFLSCQAIDDKALHALLGKDSTLKEISWSAKSLSVETANALSKAACRPELSLHLETASDDVSALLARYRGKMSVIVRESLSVQAAKTLVASGMMDPQFLAGPVLKTTKQAIKELRGEKAKGSPSLTISEQDVVDFEAIRTKIASSLPLDPVTMKDRFIFRIRKSKRETATLLSAAEIVTDEAHLSAISTYLKKPPKWDRSVYVKFDRWPSKVTPEKLPNFFEKLGASASHCAVNSEDSIFGSHADSGQTWVDEMLNAFRPKKGKLSSEINWSVHRYFLEEENDGAEFAVCAGQARILTAGPEIGDKWTNYRVVPHEICDFLNTILFGWGMICIYISHEEMLGSFLVVDLANLDLFIKKLKQAHGQ